MCSTTSVVVERTDETQIPSGSENKREIVSNSPIDEILLAIWQHHNSSMESLSKKPMAIQASGLTFFEDEPLL